MITRPLDLASKLRPPPRNLDFLFLVNAALIGLFFVLFGSRFVLAPSVAVGDLKLPRADPKGIGLAPTTLVLSIASSGLMWNDTGTVSYAQLQNWLATQAKAKPGAVLLVRCDESIPADLLFKVYEAAAAVGIGVRIATETAVAHEGGTLL